MSCRQRADDDWESTPEHLSLQALERAEREIRRAQRAVVLAAAALGCALAAIVYVLVTS